MMIIEHKIALRIGLVAKVKLHRRSRLARLPLRDFDRVFSLAWAVFSPPPFVRKFHAAVGFCSCEYVDHHWRPRNASLLGRQDCGRGLSEIGHTRTPAALID